MTATALDIRDLCDAVASAAVVVPVGARTQWEVGGPPPAGSNHVEVHAPGGVVAYDASDLTVTVGAGIPVLELVAALNENGQECPLDPRDDRATVGGVLAVGLSGPRRLRYGPVRDTVLEVRVVTADGRLIKGGGPTVKNVTGYDLPRLFVGSFGTLGVMAQVTLRCRPRATAHAWFTTDAPLDRIVASLYRPSSVLFDGRTAHVLLEGVTADIEAQAAAAQLGAPTAAPQLPEGPHRGRISIAPAHVTAIGRALDTLSGARWLAEAGVGTVHVASDDPATLAAARDAAHAAGGWLLRESGGSPGFDGFGVPLPNAELHARISNAFDPRGKCNPGRLP
jgi:glycolate oxidase FAD binding subunit